MTDRVQYLTVVLENDFRTDDVQIIIDAIQMIRGVQKVELGKALTVDDYMARQRVGYEMRKVVSDAMADFLKNKGA